MKMDTRVKKISYDAKDVETTKSSEIVKTVFEISLDRLVKAPTVTTMSVTGKNTKADVKVEANAQVSGPPMTGQF